MNHRFGLIGLVALLAYFALFSAGIAIDSVPYRERLGRAAATPIAIAAAAGPELPAISAPPPAEIDWRALVAFSLTYTPLNVGTLCILAGLIGGCASRITYVRSEAPDGGAMPDDLWFRTESPLASMLRSFLVYVAIVAGVSISTDGAFAETSREGYLRFAASVSFFAFVVGYDPTKFRDWIDRTPGLAAKKR